jgi:hypothetical protein
MATKIMDILPPFPVRGTPFSPKQIGDRETGKMVTQYSGRIPASNVVFVVSAVAIKDVGPPPYEGIWKLLLGGDAAAKIGKLLDPNAPGVLLARQLAPHSGVRQARL